jgi:hypothetical protein
MAESEFHYEFESDEGFMKFLREYEPNDPDWWHSEYSGNLRGMYAAYQAGKNQGERGADGT